MNFIKNLTTKKALYIVLQIVLLITVYLGVKAYTQRDLVQDTPPTLNATLLSGVKFNLAQYSSQAKDKSLLVHFWATWCPVCKFEEASIEAISQDYPVVTIAMQSGDDNALREYMQAEGLNFPVIVDENNVLANRFGVKAVPVSFILNAQGKIVFIEAGYTSSWGLRLRLWLAQYL